MTDEIILQSDRTLSNWHLAKTIMFLTNISMKLIQIKEMQLLYDKGYTDDDFIISKKSFDDYIDINVFNREVVLDNNIDLDYVRFSSKSNNAKDFWKKFHQLNKPMIFYRVGNNQYKSLYDGKNSIVFKEISVNSPNIFRIIGEVVIELGLFIGGQYLSNQSTEEVIKKIEMNRNEIVHHNSRTESRLRKIEDNQREIMRQNRIIIDILKNKQYEDNIKYEKFLLNEKEKLGKRLDNSLINAHLYFIDYRLQVK